MALSLQERASLGQLLSQNPEALAILNKLFEEACQDWEERAKSLLSNNPTDDTIRKAIIAQAKANAFQDAKSLLAASIKIKELIS